MYPVDVELKFQTFPERIMHVISSEPGSSWDLPEELISDKGKTMDRWQIDGQWHKEKPSIFSHTY